MVKRKPEATDPLHKWIGTYNLYRIHLMRFFRWLYYPNIYPSKNRPKPLQIEYIPQLKRKEKSIYKPTDLWTDEDKFVPPGSIITTQAQADKLPARLGSPYEKLNGFVLHVNQELAKGYNDDDSQTSY